jgi:hypothetical protein
MHVNDLLNDQRPLLAQLARFSLRQSGNSSRPFWVFLTKTAKSQFVSKNSDLSPAAAPYRGLPSVMRRRTIRK